MAKTNKRNPSRSFENRIIGRASVPASPSLPGNQGSRGRSPYRAGVLKKALVRAAARARQRAVAPYSKFKVGAALVTRSGEFIAGANVESASYGLTCCAERVALFNALTAGQRDFVAVAVVARAPGGPMPCGACRQLLAEYAPDATVWVADSRALQTIREFSVRELLPAAFVAVP